MEGSGLARSSQCKPCSLLTGPLRGTGHLPEPEQLRRVIGHRPALAQAPGGVLSGAREGRPSCSSAWLYGKAAGCSDRQTEPGSSRGASQAGRKSRLLCALPPAAPGPRGVSDLPTGTLRELASVGRGPQGAFPFGHSNQPMKRVGPPGHREETEAATLRNVLEA